jgi:hypothetical protein
MWCWCDAPYRVRQCSRGCSTLYLHCPSTVGPSPPKPAEHYVSLADTNVTDDRTKLVAGFEKERIEVVQNVASAQQLTRVGGLNKLRYILVAGPAASTDRCGEVAQGDA